MADVKNLKIELPSGGVTETLFRERLSEGVAPESMDMDGDGDVDDYDVISFHYENWQKYQGSLEKHTGFKVHWSFDDLNPKTTFDLTVRQKAAELFVRVSQKVSAQYDMKDSEQFSAALMATIQGIYDESLKDPAFFGEVAAAIDETVVKREGIFSIQQRQTRKQKEATALEFLKSKVGTCAEHVRVLMTLYELAGFHVRPIEVTMAGKGEWMSHLALQVEARRGEWIIVDPALQRFNPVYETFRVMTKTQYAGMYYRQLGFDDSDPLLLPRARFLDPHIENEFQLGSFLKKGDLEAAAAVLRRLYPNPSDPRPDISKLSWMLRKPASPMEIERLKAEILARYPGVVAELRRFIQLYISLGASNSVAGYLSALEVLSTSAEEKKDAFILKVYHYAMTRPTLETRQLIQDGMALLQTDEDFGTLIMVFNFTTDIDGGWEFSQYWIERFPESVDARLNNFLFAFVRGDYPAAISYGEASLIDPGFDSKFIGFLSLSYAKIGAFRRGLVLVDSRIASVDQETANKEQLFAHSALLRLAMGDRSGYLSDFKRMRPQNYRSYEVFKAIAFYLSGHPEMGAAVIHRFRSDPDKKAIYADFVRIDDYLPADLVRWLGSFQK